MIKNLSYSVTFPSNGISLAGDISFQPGTTAIIGDNGNGKTFGSIEMVRYLLFGKKALRGPATDYKTLDAKGRFQIQGEWYSIERNRKAERLFDAKGEILAVGAEAVTQRATQLLGYGLDVFDVANASVQKESDKLSKMLPTARRKLIDEVLGLAANEHVEKACRAEATALRRDADVLQDNLVVPVPAVRPEGYRPSSSIKAELDAGRAAVLRRAQLQQVINAVGPEPVQVDAPVEVLEPVGDLVALTQHQTARAQVLAQVEQAKRALAAIPDAEWTAEQLDAAEATNAYETELSRRGPKPTMTIETANRIVERWDHITLLKKIGDTEVDCPKCQHIFKPGQELPTNPIWSRDHCIRQLEAQGKWAVDLIEPPLGELLTTAQITHGRLAVARAGDKIALIAMTQQPIPEDRSAELEALRTAKARYEAYVVAKANHVRAAFEVAARYELARLKAIEAQAELDEMDPPVSNIDALETAHVEARVYESQLAAYDKAKEGYDETLAKIALKMGKSVAYKKGAEALVKTRQSVKAHLAPSLSRVSSSLIHQMSGGVLANMIVDEDMNITVDGQDIATLSGAGSTVANLALRLALGQVLVRSVFPVFIADEADADLSDSRAQFTAECLSSLKDRLSQIIVITHKEVTAADHIITR